ncbi:MAG TPA: TolC family protein [Ignavibacteriaceae bacterium]|nr:TolC family protein [Ignavibacteriaceae bacterium]
MIKIIKICILIFLGAFQFNLSAQQAGADNKLEELINETVRNNPQLKAARSQTEAQKTKIDQVTAWEPPQAGISFYQTPIESFPNPIKNGMETDYYIQQMFPFPGKLSSMGSSAENNASMFEQQYKGLERNIIKELKSTYYELYFVQQKIEINIENENLLKQLSDITAKQYEVGAGRQTDMLRAQTELSTLINEGVNLEKDKRNIETMLNSILNRRPDSTFDEIASIEDTIPDWSYNQLSDLAFESRPELKAMDYNIKMNKAELDASKLEYYPDLMVQLMYKNMSGTNKDFWSTMIGVNIPIAFWSKDKYSGKIEENEINIKTAEEQLNAMKNMVASQVQDAIVKIESNKNLMDLYKNTVIPQAQQTLQSTLGEYQTGKTEFLMIIDAYKMVLMAKQDYYMAQMNYMQSQAQLEEAVGLSKNEIQEKLKD